MHGPNVRPRAGRAHYGSKLPKEQSIHPIYKQNYCPLAGVQRSRIFHRVDANPGKEFLDGGTNQLRIEGTTTMKTRMSFWAVWAIVILMAAGFARAPQAQTFVSSGFNMNARVDAPFSFDCTNHPGPVISLGDGKITLGSIDAELTLSNNFKFTHSDEVAVSADVNLILPGTIFAIPKQPSR